MNNIKLLIFSLFLIFFPLEADALSVSKNDLTMKKGSTETVDLYINVEEEVSSLSFDMTFTTYDIPATLSFEPWVTSTVSGISYNLTFSEPIIGNVKIGTINIKTVDNPTVTSGSVNITYPKAYNLNGDRILLNYQDINVNISSSNTVTEPPIIENVQMLERIDSNIVSINLEKDVYDYEVNIDESVTELDLKPIVANDNYRVEMTTQKISELSDNTIVIKVIGDNKTQNYKIKVNISKKTIQEDVQEEKKQETKKSVTKFKYKWKWVLLITTLLGLLFVGTIIDKKNRK